jgi:hypothetical protein
MKKIFSILISLFLSFYSLSISAQNNEEVTISPDRPGAGTGPAVMPKKYFQIESGFTYEQTNDDNLRTDIFSYNQLLLRYGLFSFAEFRFSGDFTETKFDDNGSKSSISGFGPVNLGTKISIYEGNKCIPQTALLINAAIPKTGKVEYQVSNLAPSAYLLFQNNLTDNLSLAYNLGLEWDGESSEPATFYSIGLGYSITDKLSTYIENYGNLNSDNNSFYLDGGVAYLVTNKLQLDFYVGMDVKGIKKEMQLNIGIAWQIP